MSRYISRYISYLHRTREVYIDATQIVAARAAALRLNSITKVAKTAQSVESPGLFEVTTYQSRKTLVFHPVWLFLSGFVYFCYIFCWYCLTGYDFDLIYMLALPWPLTDLSMGWLKVSHAGKTQVTPNGSSLLCGEKALPINFKDVHFRQNRRISVDDLQLFTLRCFFEVLVMVINGRWTKWH